MRKTAFILAILFLYGNIFSLANAKQMPTKTGQRFIIDDWDNKVTQTDMGMNYFSGNAGTTESVGGITTISLSGESKSSIGGSLAITYDFSDVGENAFAGCFMSMFGLTDTLVSLNGDSQQPDKSTPFPEYFLNTKDVYRSISGLSGKSLETLSFDIRITSAEKITLKIELKDESGFDVFTRRTILAGNGWQTVKLALPNAFSNSVKGAGNPSDFDWTQVSVLAFIVERQNVGDGVANPDTGGFLIDNLALEDSDGAYPDLSQLDPVNETDDQRLFLEFIRKMSFLYFIDFASTDPRTGGIIQDRSTFADLMSVGGVGFQLTAYVIGAERGYLSRQEAAERVRDILDVLLNHPQGPDRVGTTGYKGFFYHFLGIDGLRKQNFDFEDTPDVDEALNTVELSTIDTALAIAGAVTARQYFSRDNETETQLRSFADQIYSRVDWPFMIDDERFNNTRQFILGWKPIEERDDVSGNYGRFKLDDHPDSPHGQYASKYVDGQEVPATIDFYTDEGLLIALLAMASPNPDHRVGRDVWDAIQREEEGGNFIKTYPGSLFTYQFFSAWLDTKQLGTDNHPSNPINFFENSKQAILATQEYAELNPEGRATLNGFRWGLSAAAGAFNDYFAHAAPTAAIADDGGILQVGPVAVEAEKGAVPGPIMSRSNASGAKTALMKSGDLLKMTLNFNWDSTYKVIVRYSNDNFGPLETVTVSIDGEALGHFLSEDTGNSGQGWNIFASNTVGMIILDRGTPNIDISVSGGDGYGIEVDCVKFEGEPVERPLEVGTVTNYAVGSAVVHSPSLAISALWNNVNEDLNKDGVQDLLHPRFGLADAFNLNIADASIPVAVDCRDSRILRCEGPWANYTGFAIDHGPMLIIIDNYLEDNFIPGLFMCYKPVCDALTKLFPDNARECQLEWILRILVNQKPADIQLGIDIMDINEDGKLGIEEAIYILQNSR